MHCQITLSSPNAKGLGKISLKTGFRVEACRLGTADRLICYLTLMSIVAWRLFTIMLIARTNPSMPCSELLSEQEWTVLAAGSSLSGSQAATPPSIAEAIISIAKLGGYLAKKKDGPPGTLVLLRGWDWIGRPPDPASRLRPCPFPNLGPCENLVQRLAP
jgi:hypothetical protein